MPKAEVDALTGVLADEIRMYGHAHGSWLPIDLARNLTKQLRESGWRVVPPEAPTEQEVTLAFIRALVGAWDCCGTCAGGVLAQRDRERDARLADVGAPPTTEEGR